MIQGKSRDYTRQLKGRPVAARGLASNESPLERILTSISKQEDRVALDTIKFYSNQLSEQDRLSIFSEFDTRIRHSLYSPNTMDIDQLISGLSGIYGVCEIFFPTESVDQYYLNVISFPGYRLSNRPMMDYNEMMALMLRTDPLQGERGMMKDIIPIRSYVSGMMMHNLVDLKNMGKISQLNHYTSRLNEIGGWINADLSPIVAYLNQYEPTVRKIMQPAPAQEHRRIRNPGPFDFYAQGATEVLNVLGSFAGIKPQNRQYV